MSSLLPWFTGLALIAAAVTASARDIASLGDIHWDFPVEFLRQYDPEAVAAFEPIEAPDILAVHADGTVFAIKFMGRLSPKGGDEPLEYLRKGAIEYLREYLAELDKQAARLQRAAETAPPGTKPPRRFLRRELRRLRTNDRVEFVTEAADGAIAARAEVLVRDAVIRLGFFCPDGRQLLTEMRLDNVLDSMEPLH